jgi:hypothetical protein
MTDFEDDTPTEADLDACYGSKYLSATEVGDRKIRTKIARVRKQALPQQGGGTRTKFVLSFSTIDKEMVLNATNKDDPRRCARAQSGQMDWRRGRIVHRADQYGRQADAGVATAGAQQAEQCRTGAETCTETGRALAG